MGGFRHPSTAIVYVLFGVLFQLNYLTRIPITYLLISKMSDAEKPLDAEQQEEVVSSYIPPPQKSIGELIAADQEDESLRKYKEALLGNAISEAIVIEPNNPEKVLVRKLVLVSEGQAEKVLDLTGDISKLKKTIFTIKEGVQYKIRIEFFVQHEIVTGLKYVQKTYRKGIQGIISTYA